MAGNHLNTRQVLGNASILLLIFASGLARAGTTCESAVPGADSIPPASAEHPDALQYGEINRAMLQTDDVQRRSQLNDLIARLSSTAHAENDALLPRLQIALAYSEIRLGNTSSAIAILKQVPLESSQAASALVLLGEVTYRTGSTETATSWILHAANLYPQKPEVITGLLSAAEWQKYAHDALPLLLQAKLLVDDQFHLVSDLMQRSRSSDFIESLGLEHPDTVLWSFASEALTDPAFVHAKQSHLASRSASLCLQTHLEKANALRDKNPTLIRDLDLALQDLDVLIPKAQKALIADEASFLDIAQRYKHCHKNGQDCHELRAARDLQGRRLTSLRNRLHNMEQQHRFLEAEQKSISGRWIAEQRAMSAVGMRLMQQNSENRQIMKVLLQQALVKSHAQWQELSANVYFRLANAQNENIKELREQGALLQSSRM